MIMARGYINPWFAVEDHSPSADYREQPRYNFTLLYSPASTDRSRDSLPYSTPLHSNSNLLSHFHLIVTLHVAINDYNPRLFVLIASHNCTYTKRSKNSRRGRPRSNHPKSSHNCKAHENVK